MRHIGLELEFEIEQHKTVALKDDGDLTVFLYERPDAHGNGSCTLTFQVHDVDAKHRELSANGVIFEKPPQKLFWGYGAELRDPDGYLIYRWNRLLWAILFTLSVFSFIHILIGPTSGYVSQLNPAAFIAAGGIFAIFGAFSIATWGFFRFRPAPEAGELER